MIWQAAQSGFGYFQREVGYTRTGSHNSRVHGRETGQWHEADLAVAAAAAAARDVPLLVNNAGSGPGRRPNLVVVAESSRGTVRCRR
jgi:hypothetical protein